MATSSNDNKQGSKQDKSGDSKQSDTSKRGFASMDPELQREIASEGGRAAHEKGTAHEFTSEEARRAGSQSHKNDGSRQSAASGSGSRDTARADQDQDQEEKGGGASASRQSKDSESGSRQSKDSESGSRQGQKGGSSGGSGSR
ncbi:uncharacterized protein ACFDR9_001146 [Janthinobacterium sp. CG_23.3]|uniref:KGG domain-containing protein n=1 Tax=Janthinobacterium sp. CG_23.3 TaxID=3349634 RepID=UPI0038D3AB63